MQAPLDGTVDEVPRDQQPAFVRVAGLLPDPLVVWIGRAERVVKRQVSIQDVMRLAALEVVAPSEPAGRRILEDRSDGNRVNGRHDSLWYTRTTTARRIAVRPRNRRPRAVRRQAGTPCSRSQCTTFKLRTPWVAEDDQCGFVGLGFQLLQASAFAIAWLETIAA